MKLVYKFILIPVCLLIKTREFRFFFKAIPYIWNKNFLKVELWRLLVYFFCNKWKISKEHRQSCGCSDTHCFGETPLVTLQDICKKVRLKRDHVFLEAGSATGRNCLWISAFIQCKVIGVEYIPFFVKVSRWLSKKLVVKYRPVFIEGDMLMALPKEVDVVYLYGSHLNHDEINSFAKCCLQLQENVVVITVSYALSTYQPEYFEIVNIFPGLFVSGIYSIYVQRLRSLKN